MKQRKWIGGDNEIFHYCSELEHALRQYYGEKEWYSSAGLFHNHRHVRKAVLRRRAPFEGGYEKSMVRTTVFSFPYRSSWSHLIDLRNGSVAKARTSSRWSGNCLR